MVRESGLNNREFIFGNLCTLGICILKIFSVLFPFSSYYILHYFIVSFEFILWLSLPLIGLKLACKFFNAESFVENFYFSICLYIPILVVAVLSGLSPFYDLIFKLNLFGEPVFGKYYFIVNYFIVMYTALNVFVCIRALFLRTSSDRTQVFMMMLFSISMCVCQILTNFFRSNLVIIGVFTIFLILSIFLHENLVFIDPLTGLNNRNRFKKYLSGILNSYALENSYLTYVDIDDFKKINDNYGHLVGNIALRTVAEAMRDIEHKHNIFISRLGGDEFAIISTNFSETDLIDMLNELRESVRNKNKQSSLEVEISLSMGSTSLNLNNSSVNDIIKLADKKMYMQKQEKKNNNAKDNQENK